MEYIKKYNINWSPNFQKELGNIYSYINNVLNEHTTAVKLYDTIITEIYSLHYFTEKFPKIYNFKFKNRNLRKFIIKKFIIIYEVDKQKR
jgi:hypothetical protein